MKTAKIQLPITAILNIPIHIYDKDFTFIVNGEEFKTSKIVSDLLSPKICKIHLIDPTFDLYTVNTTNQGNFSHFLQLINFDEKEISFDELQFICEILENFQNEIIAIKLPQRKEEITLDNIFELIQLHENHQRFYSQYFDEEIEFISKHFYELREDQESCLREFKLETLTKIFENKKLLIRDENQLLKIINELYRTDPKYSGFYKYVYFPLVDEKTISEFIEIFDINDIDSEIWQKLSIRLKQKVDLNDQILNDENKHQYRKAFVCNHDDVFDGIINYLIKKSNNNIKNLIDITTSSILRNDQTYSPYNVCLYDDNEKYFESEDQSNSWICFDFKDHKIIPSNYIIKSSQNSNDNHPRTWILEGSNDKTNWKVLDEQKDCSYLNGQYLVHTFDIQAKTRLSFRYIRMKQTDKNWQEGYYHYLVLGSMEFYGNLI